MDEWKEGIKQAIIIVIIVAIIGVAFGLVYMALNAASKGQDKLATQLTELDNRAYDAYNNVIVTGANVTSAIKQFQGQPVAVLVFTKRNISGDGNGINYCALIGASGDTAPTLADNPTFALTSITKDEAKGKYYVDDSLSVWQSVQNTNLKQSNIKSSQHYINPAAKYTASLLYDVNDEIVGIVFEQNE